MKTTDKYDPAVQCVGKHPFPTFSVAESTISKKRDNSFQIYKCPACGFFHIGHSTSKMRSLKRGPK
jgi:hypothetical protein